MSKHTEGEWEAKQMPDGVWTVRTVYHDDQGRRVTAWPAVCNAGAQPNEANATLFAASKDMLEALQAIVSQADELDELGIPALAKGRAAIAKATLTRKEDE